MRPPKYSDRLIYGLATPGVVMVGVGLFMPRGGMLQNILCGIGGVLSGAGWLITMLNAVDRQRKD
jgi:hypothetical protein